MKPASDGRFNGKNDEDLMIRAMEILVPTELGALQPSTRPGVQVVKSRSVEELRRYRGGYCLLFLYILLDLFSSRTAGTDLTSSWED
jgi:hypothetical protein